MTHTMKHLLGLVLLAMGLNVFADESVYGPQLQGFDYPAPVLTFNFIAYRQPIQMAYLDYPSTALVLQKAGMRVIVPDQVGFCKSSKPIGYEYSFAELASNTYALLKSLKIEKATIVGHSMGGMLATRYALIYPDAVTQLVLVNPLGLEDWKAMGVPSLTDEQWYQRELAFTDERLRNYQLSTYYANEWKPEYEPWIQMIAGMYRGPGKQAVAWSAALTFGMIFNQPVVHEFPQIKVPTLLLIGEKDTTAIGRDLVDEPLKSQLGNYRAMALRAVKAIPGARLVLFPDMGHAPQIQNPDRFKTALVHSLVALDKD